MQISTKRLLIREFAPDDEPSYLAFHAEQRFAEFAGPEDLPPDRARELLRLFSEWATEQPRENFQLAIAEAHTPHQVIGSCGLRMKGRATGVAEFGLELAPACWGHGYAVEAARALIGFGFRELALREVQSESVSANVRVVGLAQRIGLVEVGSRPGPAWMTARGWNTTEWRLTREAWEHLAGT